MREVMRERKNASLSPFSSFIFYLIFFFLNHFSLILISVNSHKIPKNLENVNFLIEIFFSIRYFIKFNCKYIHVNKGILNDK